MKQQPFFHLCPGLIVVTALAALLSGTANATDRVEKKDRVEKITFIEEGLTHPTFRTLKVDSCSKKRTERGEWVTDDKFCSRARLIYPRYKKFPWLNQLIAQSVILPMFAGRLDENSARGGSEALYKDKLASLVRKGGAYGSVEKPPLIEFTAKLTGYEKSSLSPAGVPRPEIFGSYLQFMFEHELSQQYDVQPAGPTNSFVVIDTHGRRVLTFDDLILPGQEKALEDLQLEAFHAWLKTELKFPDKAIEVHLANPLYPFRLNKNWGIVEGGLMFRFGVYEVGPYPFGSPKIFVEKDRLRNIIQPNILEQIPGGGLAGN
ncbi:MAG: RsiV family protein [Azoarcus sp.]|jgi:hypothetical protein|nr:RsiV family protein [Azoarcus sp.]